MSSVLVFLPMLSDISSENESKRWIPAGVYPVLRYGAGMTLLFFLLSIISGCAGNVILSDDSMRIRKTVDMVNDLKANYEQHDDHILTMFSAEYLSKPEMKNAILQDMEKFNTISLHIFIDRILIDKDMGNVTVHWNGSWGDSKKTFREGGSAVIVIRYGDGLRVMDIKGESPFGITQRLFGNKE